METTDQNISHAPNAHTDGRMVALQEDFYHTLEHKGRSSNTLKNYKTDLECFNTFLSKQGEKLNLERFDLSFVQEYGAYLQRRYNSDNSRRRRVQALRMFFDFLVERELLSTNPVRKLPTSPKFLDIPRPTPFVDVKTLWIYLLEEEKQRGDLARLVALRNQVIMLLVFGAGLKVSDLAGLQAEHIMVSEEGARVLISHPKRDPYTVPLPKVFIPVFEAYTDLLGKIKSREDHNFTEILFNANPYRILSGGLSPRGLEVVFEEIRKRLLITLTPKSLRQACIFKWLHQGHSESLIKEWMGVAPSYSLKGYKEHQSQYLYHEDFLEEYYFDLKRRPH